MGTLTAAPQEPKIIQSISDKMKEQEECWNKGDIPCFMKHYWKSDSLRFVGKSGINYGWQKTLDNYLVAYPDVNAMGKLTFSNEVMEFVDTATIQVIGKWELKRSEELGDLSGYYTLLWKIKEGKWVIVSDHSS